jgi:hypothetical protein
MNIQYKRGNFMKKERTLSYVMSKKLTEQDLQSVSAANGTTLATSNVTYGPRGKDVGFDVTVD